MKFSLSWLKQFLETDASAEALAEKLVDMGLEVEGIEDEAASFNGVVVGKVLTREQHPDADRLGVCSVDIGEDAPRTIVCGAPNARAGITVAVAVEGACLPGDFVIKAAKVRGVTSHGMMCSEKELGLGLDHDGIIELETDASVGTPFAEVLGKDDQIFDVSITPNRGDALSVYGIARDLAAGGMGRLKPLLVQREAIQTAPSSTEVITHDACPFFTLTRVGGVDNSAQLPKELTDQLIKADFRSINPLADITNYMLMAYGQPMHAYDADKVKGNIRVAPAKGGEALVGLDGNTHTLAAGDIAIMDDTGVIGLAGIVGGETTAVDENTKNLYLEVAQFDKNAIAKTGQRLHCNTDARYRFERGIDPSMTVNAAQLALNAVKEYCGGTAERVLLAGRELPEVRTILFNPMRIKTFGGLDLSKEEVKASLEALYFDVKEKADDLLEVTVPYHCTIMDTPEDLVEEILRLKGLNAVPTLLPDIPLQADLGMAKGRMVDRMARRFFASNGFLECINYSFVSKSDALLNADEDVLYEIDNPLDEEHMSVMRTSLLPILLRMAGRNRDRSIPYVRLAEVGKTYTQKEERQVAAAVVLGQAEKHWSGVSVDDAFTMKKLAEDFLAEWGIPADRLQVRAQAHEVFYHPGRSGVLALGKNVFATFGEAHPAFMKSVDVKGRAFFVEFDLTAIDNMQVKAGKFTASTYQPVSRDFALLVDESVAAGDLVSAFKGADRNLVKDVNVFDVYQGENVGAGKKSIALSITLQATDRTLTEEDINAVCDKAVKAVTKNYGAEVR